MGSVKQPYCFEVGQGDLFALAGLWDQWKSADGEIIESCTILTTTPNSLVADMHDRMPVILDPDDYDLWLDQGMRDTTAASELLKTFNARLMQCYPVSMRINSAANDDEDCSRPVELADLQSRLSSGM
jgi:putative SOS response-associated peptidase YedK